VISQARDSKKATASAWGKTILANIKYNSISLVACQKGMKYSLHLNLSLSCSPDIEGQYWMKVTNP